MAKVKFKGQTLEIQSGQNLRKALLKKGLSPHNGNAQWLNCKGFGTCGTCALEIIEGEAKPMNMVEKWRLNFPPHILESGLRLACQHRVEGDLVLKKHPGFWGEKKP